MDEHIGKEWFRTEEVDWNNHPLLPRAVYEYIMAFNYNNFDTFNLVGGGAGSISVEMWARIVADCKNEVVDYLGVPDEEKDVILHENNTIEVLLMLFILTHCYKFDDDLREEFRVMLKEAETWAQR